MNATRSRTTIHSFLETTTLEDLLFYAAFALFSIAEIVESTDFIRVFSALDGICTALLYFSAAMLIIRLAALRASHVQWVLVLIVCVISGILYKLYGFQYPLWIFLFVISGKGVNLKVIAEITLLIAGVLTAVTIFACYVGVLENYVMYATDTRALRNSMGFLHPNRLGERIAEICIAYWYLQGSAHRGRVIVVCLISTTYVYFVSNSRTSCVVFILLILAVALYPLLARAPRVSVCACSIAVAVVVAASFYFMACYDPSNNFMVGLNELLTGRLNLMHSSYKYALPSILGNDYSGAPIVGYTVATGTASHFIVDNAYSHLVLLYGLGATALFLFLTIAVYHRCFLQRTFPFALLGLTVLLVSGFVENFTLDIQYNFFLLLIADAVYARGMFLQRGGDDLKASDLSYVADRSGHR